MIKEARGFGATIEEAKENAVINLGASELDDIQYDIISMPKKKAFEFTSHTTGPFSPYKRSTPQ